MLDATGGLGRDAFVLASLGCTVTVVERSPVVAALLKDGLKRAEADQEVSAIARRIKLVQGDSQALLPLFSKQEESIDVVYLDPMFPHREKSALVKKEMRLFQSLLGADADANELLQPALGLAKYRVVVKRPKGAPDLGLRTPSYRLEGKACRYDVYTLKAFK